MLFISIDLETVKDKHQYKHRVHILDTDRHQLARSLLSPRPALTQFHLKESKKLYTYFKVIYKHEKNETNQNREKYKRNLKESRYTFRYRLHSLYCTSDNFSPIYFTKLLHDVEKLRSPVVLKTVVVVVKFWQRKQYFLLLMFKVIVSPVPILIFPEGESIL